MFPFGHLKGYLRDTEGPGNYQSMNFKSVWKTDLDSLLRVPKMSKSVNQGRIGPYILKIERADIALQNYKYLFN